MLTWDQFSMLLDLMLSMFNVSTIIVSTENLTHIQTSLQQLLRVSIEAKLLLPESDSDTLKQSPELQ
jgi:hypothetical protein